MSLYAEMGFLSNDTESHRQEFSRNLAVWIELYFEVNKLGQAQITKPSLTNSDKRSIFITVCFMRVQSAFQSTFLLLERGAEPDAKTLLRTMLESLFVLGACVKDVVFSKRYIRRDEKLRCDTYDDALQTHFRLIADGKPGSLDQTTVEKMRRIVRKLKKEFNDPQSHQYRIDKEPEIKIEEIATTAGLSHLYDQLYSYFCNYTHPSPFGLTSYIQANSQGLISHVKLGPIYTDSIICLRFAILVALTALTAFCKHFDIGVSEEYNNLVKKFDHVARLGKNL